MNEHPLTKEQQSNLAKTAIYMLQDQKLQLLMSRYSSLTCPIFDGLIRWQVLPFMVVAVCDKPADQFYAKEDCGASCCFAGYGPYAGVRSLDYEKWHEYVKRVFGADTGDDEIWNFLFSGRWSDSREEAAARALAFLSNPRVVSTGAGDCLFAGIRTAEQLTAELEPYVLP